MWRWCRCILWLSKHIVGKYLRAWWWDWIDETCEEYGCLEDCVSCVLSPGLVLCITSHGDMWHLVLWSCLVYKTSHMSPCIKTSHMVLSCGLVLCLKTDTRQVTWSCLVVLRHKTRPQDKTMWLVFIHGDMWLVLSWYTRQDHKTRHLKTQDKTSQDTCLETSCLVSWDVLSQDKSCVSRQDKSHVTMYQDKSHGLVLWSCLVSQDKSDVTCLVSQDTRQVLCIKTSHMSPCIKTSHMSPSHMSPCDLIETCDVWLDRDMSRDMWLDRDMWLICAAMWETVYVQTCVTWCHTTWWCDLMWMLCESWRTYEWVMVQKWMSHGTHISILRMCAMLPSYVWRDSFIRDTWLYKHMHTYIYYIYIYLNIHVNMYLYIYIYIQIWIYMSHSNVRRVSFIRNTLLYIYICIYVYIYICILVYIYTYTNI